MFKNALSEQCTKFMGMLSIIIQGPETPPITVHLLALMGKSHKDYVVLPHHYIIVEDVFLSVLRGTFPEV